MNALSAESLLEGGVDITGETPTLIDPPLVRDDIAARVRLLVGQLGVADAAPTAPRIGAR